MKILLHAFQCDPNGVSEAYLGYRWKKGLSELCNVTLVTGSKEYPYPAIKPSLQWRFRSKYLQKVNSAIKLDYFYFNKSCARALRDEVNKYDILHHVSPVAPRYPVSLSEFSKKFILGPVAGGLRVPAAFQKEVEADEDLFLKLRELDKFRFRFDRDLKKTYERADKIIIAGEYVLNKIPEKLHSRCVTMLDVGIDTTAYTVKPRNYQSEKLNLIYVGRIVPYKGLIYLLKAINILPLHIKRNILLDVVGDGGGAPYEAKCRDFISKNKLQNEVSFKGFLDKKTVESLYEKSHVFCFPSLAEAGGTVVLEAMAKGLPVISVDYGGPAESVTPQSGYLIPPETPQKLIEGLAEKIHLLFQNRELLEKLSIGARIRAEEQFDWSKRCLRMVKIYKETL